MTKVTPLGKNILLEIVDEKETQTKAGIFLPEGTDTESHKKAQGKVVAVGPSPKVAERGLAVGQTVIYSKYSGTEVEVEGTKYVIVSVDDVLATISKGK